MNVLFIANIELNENEGIYKKILHQAIGLKKANKDGWLITKCKKGCKTINLQNYNFEKNDSSILSKSKEIVLGKNIKLVYIRHMIPSIGLIKFLAWLKKNNIKIYYEIPTYPYFAEQYRTAKKKYRALAKIILDIIFWPFIYMYINRLVVIKSNTKVKIFKKMIEINNGVNISDLEIKQNFERNKDQPFRMVAVGTIYPYHGYDRILKGLYECSEKVNDRIVEFHVIGESPTIDELKKNAHDLGLKNVIFHVIKTTNELNDMYNMFDVGLGCMALKRRNADIDTTLKIIEYYCRGIPVVTSGISPMDNFNKKYTIHVANTEDNISIENIYNEFSKINISELNKIAYTARKIFSWEYIIKNACK